MSNRSTTLFLCGDVMTGRGLDRILPGAGDPALHERNVSSAVEYVRLAERAHGPIPSSVDFDYPWGIAREELERRDPAVRVVNLETAVTRSESAAIGKGIHYRMHPDNLPCLSAAGLDVCGLANNHVLDWGEEGLRETLRVLEEAGIQTPGAGRNERRARRPAVVPRRGGAGRILVFAAATASSGVPASWAATSERAGVWYLDAPTREAARRVAAVVEAARTARDLVVFSIHWGGNWGWGIPDRQRAFARGLVDRGTVDLVHGHSAHHVKGFELRRERLILYGCGDLITDYEGIRGREEYRGDLGLMYFPTLRADGRLASLEMVPTRMRRLRLQRPPAGDVECLVELLNRENKAFGTRVKPSGTRRLNLVR